jgi:hypothetical protein
MEDNNQANEPVAPYERPLNFDQVWLMFQETDKLLTKKFQETDKKFQETDKKFQVTDKKIKELAALFTTQWGKLIETLVEGDLIKLLNQRGIPVERTIQRVKGHHKGQNYEYDIIAVNGDEIVIAEVKTTLRPQDVNEFHEKLWKAKTYMSEYKDKMVYGCVAFLSCEGASDRMAEKLGFFVIKATGSSSSIINQEDFQPKVF